MIRSSTKVNMLLRGFFHVFAHKLTKSVTVGGTPGTKEDVGGKASSRENQTPRAVPLNDNGTGRNSRSSLKSTGSDNQVFHL